MIRLARAAASIRSVEPLARPVAILGLLAIAVLSLIPNNLPVRTGVVSGETEHFFAYLITAAATAVAFPKQRTAAALLLIGGAIALELLQILVDRHPRMIDAAGSSLGAVCGSLLAWLTTRLSRAG